MQKTIDPYRMLFPLGVLLGLWGTAVWVPYSFRLTDYYPGVHHAFFMIGGFLLAFAAGFLMTTMPKFTGTWPASKIEISFVSVPLTLLPFFSLLSSQIFFFASLTFSISALCIFGFRRFQNKRGQPPEPFLFIGFGLASGWLGAALSLLSSIGFSLDFFPVLSRLLFLHAFILCLVVGVGSRLVPAFTGWGPMLSLPGLKRILTRNEAIYLFFSIGVLFIASIFIEALIDITIGRWLRTLIITFTLLSFWRIYKFPPAKTRVTWGIWIAAWSLLIGLWGACLQPSFAIHYYHLTFISGLSLMTLMIATRIILGHGGHGFEIEQKSKSLWVVIGLAALAAVTRYSAGMSQSMYLTHLAYASITWIAAIGIWAWVVGRKLKSRA